MIKSSNIEIDREKGNFHYPTSNYAFDAGVGLSEDVVKYISDVKNEQDWILDFRLKAHSIFKKKPMPTHWASKDLENIDFDVIRYYLAQGQQPSRTWEEVPDDIKKTSNGLGFPNRRENSLPEWRLNSIARQRTRE